MTDREFELLLEDRLTDLPPDDNLVAEITPWRRAANRILMGTALCSITLNFLLLNYILPAIGLGLILLGFRSLRRENRWFMAGYTVAVLRVIQCIFNLIRSATIWNGTSPWMRVTGVSLTILHALCIWGGFRAVQLKAGVEQSSKGFWLVVFFVLITVLGAAGFQSSLVILILLVLYILLLHSLWKYAGFLDDAGYAVQASPVRLSDRAVAIILAVITAIGILCGYLFFDRYPMEWKAMEDISADAAEIRTELLELGFPEDILNDLAEEDLLACRGASAVHAQTHDHWTEDDEQLHMSQIAVEIPGNRKSFVLFHHFWWKTDPAHRGCDAFQLWNSDHIDGWFTTQDLTGQVLYDHDGSTWRADWYSMEQTTYMETVSAYALPRRGENIRGYITYTVEERNPGYLLHSLGHYVHQKSNLLYPFKTASDMIRPNIGGVEFDAQYWFSSYWNQIMLLCQQNDSGGFDYYISWE